MILISTCCRSTYVHFQDIIAEDPLTHGGVFVPVILGSDKMTVSVATGQNKYYPLYGSIRNVHNTVHHAHQCMVCLVGFLSIPKGEPLCPSMTTPEVSKCSDGHFWSNIYGLGLYIADYQEQVLLGCTIQGWCVW